MSDFVPSRAGQTELAVAIGFLSPERTIDIFPTHFPYLVSIKLALPEKRGRLSMWRCVCNEYLAPTTVLKAKEVGP